MAFYTTGSLIGVDFNTTSTTQLFALGTKVEGSDNTEWTYARAGSAITANKACLINANYTVAMCSAADIAIAAGVSAAGRLGWAQVAFAADDYGWVPTSGTLYIMTTGSSTLDSTSVPVCLGGSAVSTGMCSMVATTTNTMMGIHIVAHGSGGQTASATAAKAIITFPRTVAAAAS